MGGHLHYERAGQAILAMRRQAGLTQTDLAARLRALGLESDRFKFDQSKVSKWERGEELPGDIEAIPAIERECGVPLGTILRAAGMVDDPGLDVRTAITADPDIDEMTKSFLLHVYSDAVERATSRTRSPSAAKDEATSSSAALR